jgi:hypothetical protein
VARVGVTIAVVLGAAFVSASPLGAKYLDGFHPSPVRARQGHGVALCPNPNGLQVFTPAAQQHAAQQADAYGRRSLAEDLANTDKAWWPHVRALWKMHTARKQTTDVVVGDEPATRSGFAVFLRPACGAATLRRTLMVTVGPSQAGPGPHCDACNAHFFYIDRQGRSLLWFIY